MSFQKALAGIIAGIIALAGIIFGLPTSWATPEVQGIIVTVISTVAALLWKDGKTVIYASAAEAATVVADEKTSATYASLSQ